MHVSFSCDTVSQRNLMHQSVFVVAIMTNHCCSDHDEKSDVR